ncbi:monoheme cytochrome C [uncultured Eudoraea sp.]|uniref:monoheme cytochrome C n=1 Tax=uncultured Eudoraea sp. TaxID=1035614 RepID=UPI0026065B75|nr:monoheme cytochrome C [uncultured Eudoraea sp.]
MQEHAKFKQQVKAIYRLMAGLFGLFIVAAIGILLLVSNPDWTRKKATEVESEYVAIPEVDDFDKIENGIHVRTGLIEADGLMTVVNNCTNCHSAKLVTQNRMNAERWIATIKWMQETQNLWDLGKNEEIIVNYLVTNYPAKKKGRREVLSNIEWYDLED